ncbi:hypothetical protein MKleb_5527 (plasmid) [Klebsiella sp. PL-2018]|nr:hypothetical protein MKleb_5527 [Klebsiella sp. PL-2018]
MYGVCKPALASGMDTRCPAVYRRAGRRQRSWLSAQHDSRPDARAGIPLPVHLNRQKKNSRSRNSSRKTNTDSISMNISTKHQTNQIPNRRFR